MTGDSVLSQRVMQRTVLRSDHDLVSPSTSDTKEREQEITQGGSQESCTPHPQNDRSSLFLYSLGQRWTTIEHGKERKTAKVLMPDAI